MTKLLGVAGRLHEGLMPASNVSPERIEILEGVRLTKRLLLGVVGRLREGLMMDSAVSPEKSKLLEVVRLTKRLLLTGSEQQASTLGVTAPLSA